MVFTVFINTQEEAMYFFLFVVGIVICWSFTDIGNY